MNATRICKRKWPHGLPTRHQRLNANKIKRDPGTKTFFLNRYALYSGKSICDWQEYALQKGKIHFNGSAFQLGKSVCWHKKQRISLKKSSAKHI